MADAADSVARTNEPAYNTLTSKGGRAVRISASIKRFMNGGFRSLLYRFIIFFLVISLLIQVINWVTYRVNLQYFESEVEQNYNKSLSSIAADLNNVFNGIFNSNYLLSLDSDAVQLFSSNFSVDKPSDYAFVAQSIRSLNRIRLMNDSIDSVFIYKKKNNLVVSSKGSYSALDYFTTFSPLEKYPSKFWQEYDTRNAIFRILPPSRSKNGEYILPIVQTAIAEYQSDDLYVIHLKLAPLLRQLNDSKLTPNSELLILDANRELLASTEMAEPGRSEMYELAMQIAPSENTSLKLKLQGEGMLAIQNNTNFLFGNLDMIAFVPQKDILYTMKKVKDLGLVMSSIALVLSVLLSILLSKKLYSPMNALIAKLSSPLDPPTNEYQFLDHEFHRMKSDMDVLHENLSRVSPMAIEQWFVRMLRYNRVPDEQNIRSFMEKCGVRFQHGHFAVALIRVTFSKSYLVDYSPAEKDVIHANMMQTLKAALPLDSSSFILEIESNIVCLIVNLNRDANLEEYTVYFESMIAGFQHDTNLQDLFVGMGGVHEGFEGLQRSYLEAMKSLWRLTPYYDRRIHYYNEDDERSIGVMLTAQDENKLYNLLLSSKREELFDLLQSIIGNHIALRMNDIVFKELYLNLYMIGAQVLKFKDKTLPESAYREYVRMILMENAPTVQELSDSIAGYYNQIMDSFDTGESRLEQASFKAFIDAHYHEDIHLEYLAGKFNTSANYMSRLLKKELGQSFQQYLQELRIRKAKQLLTTTDVHIHEIWAAVGFNNRNSFIRTFKNLEGISPLEYRNQHSASAGKR